VQLSFDWFALPHERLIPTSNKD